MLEVVATHKPSCTHTYICKHTEENDCQCPDVEWKQNKTKNNIRRTMNFVYVFLSWLDGSWPGETNRRQTKTWAKDWTLCRRVCISHLFIQHADIGYKPLFSLSQTHTNILSSPQLSGFYVSCESKSSFLGCSQGFIIKLFPVRFTMQFCTWKILCKVICFGYALTDRRSEVNITAWL